VRYDRPAIVAMLINEGLEADVRNDSGQYVLLSFVIPHY
jgi:membrane protease subunit (stomatin/prohibitin family)